ncbi:hypothetical protein JJE00_03400, partial [Candidatus Bathyarchaeota archaeon]|nr:hypothetical protein [Candidatus Bathyarchaeota archaeon]
IIMWTALPQSRISILDVQLGIINAAIMIPLNLFALFWIIKGKRWAPLYFIAISIGNRLWSQPLFDGGIHMIFVTWTSLLLVFAYNEYRGLSNSETAVLSGGVILDLALSSLIFNPVDSLTYGIIFYVLFLVGLVGALIAIKKLR